MYNIVMKILLSILLVIAFAIVNAAAQKDDAALVAEIREAYKKVNEQIAEMQKAPEYSSVFVTEIVVNKNNASYPAVGVYNSTVRLYYTYGDREKNPYPDRLLKATVTTRRSSRTETYEYMFGENGELIFAFEKKDKIERRAYFRSSRLVRSQLGDAIISNDKTEAKQAAAKFLAEAKRLRATFVNSL